MEGIVLRAYNSGESDLVLKVISKNSGKISIYAPAAKKSRKRFGSTPDLIDWGIFELTRSKNDFEYLKSFKAHSSFPMIRTDFNKLNCAYILCESFDYLIPESSEKSEDLFESLRLGLLAIEKSNELKDSLRATHISLSSLLRFCGYLESDLAPSKNNLLRIISRIEHFSEREIKTKKEVIDLINEIKEKQD